MILWNCLEWYQSSRQMKIGHVLEKFSRWFMQAVPELPKNIKRRVLRCENIAEIITQIDIMDINESTSFFFF